MYKRSGPFLSFQLINLRKSILAAAAMPVVCLIATASAQTVTVKTNANIVTPSQANAAQPFAQPIAIDFQNFQVQPVEAPNSITNPST
ncbi:MAG TPA: hypothetical protein VGF52_02165, partial [Tepidisphaeraceae bacterium]